MVGVPGTVARNAGVSDSRARALHAALSSLFGWLMRFRYVETNAAQNVHRPAAAKARERVLSNAEIVWFWNATGPIRGGLQAKSASRFGRGVSQTLAQADHFNTHRKKCAL
jgi:hypothetical protein